LKLQNGDIARALETIVTLMEIKGEDHYRVLAYQRAAESVAAAGRSVADMEDIKELPHVGGTTAEVIGILAKNQTPQILMDLLEEIPSGLVEITRIPWDRAPPVASGTSWTSRA
jgi:DNA polymerase (family 10)